MFPKRSTQVKSYDGQTKWIYFLVEVDDLLGKHSTTWNKVSAERRKELASEPVQNKEYLKQK